MKTWKTLQTYQHFLVVCPKSHERNQLQLSWQVQHLHLQKHSQVRKTIRQVKSASVSHPPVTSGVSPSKAIELRMKNFEQLLYLQQLHDDGILNSKEFTDQKQKFCHLYRNSHKVYGILLLCTLCDSASLSLLK